MASRSAVTRLAKLSSTLPRQHGRQSIRVQQRHFKWARPVPATQRYFSGTSNRAVKKYSEDHEWVELDSDGTTGTIGISTYAAKALGDVVYVELPVVDAEVSKGDTIGAVESVKSASDLLTPVSGTILETNTELEKSPGNINKNPEGESWIAKIKIKDTTEFDSLMDKEAYAAFTTE